MAYLNKKTLDFLVALFLTVLPMLVFAQDTVKRFSFQFNETTLDVAFRRVERTANIRIFFRDQDINRLTVSKSFDNVTLEEVISGLLSGTTLFHTNHNGHFFITKDVKLSTYNATMFNTPSFNNKIKVLSNEGAKVFNKLYEVGLRTNELKKGTATLVGYVVDEMTKKVVPSARITALNGKSMVITDNDGLFAISLPLGLNYLDIWANDYKSARRQLILYGDGKLNLEIKQNVELLKEVRILSQRGANLKNLEMGVNKLSIASIKQVPAVFGEPDVLRVVLTLPGVQSVGEASTGFNVRGGSADQNLILLDNSTVYNPSHFFGFFSAFNPDLVKDVQLYKSTIPERFGGRLSSVLEVQNRQGEKSKLKGSAGIGMITSRVNVEAPIDSGKTSFIFGGRGTYSNWLLDLLPEEYKNSNASFYDFNLGLSHLINKRNELNLMLYYSKDDFRLNSDTSYSYGNKNASFEWKRMFSPKLNGVFKAAVDNYGYSINSDQNPINAYKLNFRINQVNVKSDFKYSYNDRHFFNFGLSSTHYNLSPGEFLPFSSSSLVAAEVLQKENALETAIYFGDEYKLNDKLSFNLGLRYVVFNAIGPRETFYYADNLPKSDVNIVEIKKYKSAQIFKTYHAPEIRLASRYIVANDLTIKASYNTLRQYIHLLSNTMAIAPTDVWKLSDANIRPQRGFQVALGLYKSFAAQTIETSIEGYYKRMVDFLDYKSGATIVMNPNIEQDVTSTKGKAYGVEIFLKKNIGKLNGWLSYAYSRVLLKMDNISEGPLVNGGDYYPANYDKPHSFNFTGNYKIKQRYHFSLNFTYSTGRPITLPIAKYFYAGSERVYYSDRNAYRIPNYLRTDVSFNIEGNHKVKQLTHNSWTFGVYNLTGRRNVFSTFFTQEAGTINGYNLSIFATAIPFVNYNIKF